MKRGKKKGYLWIGQPSASGGVREGRGGVGGRGGGGVGGGGGHGL